MTPCEHDDFFWKLRIRAPTISDPSIKSYQGNSCNICLLSPLSFLPSFKHFRLPATVNPNQKFYLIFCQSPPGHLPPPPPPHPTPWTQQSFTRPCLAPQGSGISGLFIDLVKHLPPVRQSLHIVLICLPIFSPKNFSGISQVCGLVPHLNLLHATHSSYLHNLDTRAHSRIRIRIYIQIHILN